MDTDGGPQADDGGEQGLIIRTSFILSGAHQATQVSDERLMINDFVHTENTEGNGGPQADGFVGKQQLSSIGQQLKEKFFLIAVILQVIAVQEKELVVCGLQLP
ncbi:MAG: hypothetical protein SOZ29_07855 [Prevotella sp.]|nr:hypothetical protein [Prevotella sp.]